MTTFVRVGAMLLAFLLPLTIVHTQTKWTKYPGNPVLDAGGQGTWDRSQAFFSSVVFRDSSYTMWYSGRDGDGYKFQVGRATSPDGIHWMKDPLNPVMSFGPLGSWDEFGAWIPRVLFDGSQYRMWYMGASVQTFGTWQTGEATSTDGRTWQKNILDPVLTIGAQGTWESGGASPDAILFDGSMYKMWYTGQVGDYPPRSEGVGYATSIDGIHWTRNAQNPVLVAGPAGSWDEFSSNEVCVLYDSGHYYMWFTGNDINDISNTSGIGYAVSKDGIHWKEFPGNPVVRGGGSGAWDEHVFGPFVRQAGSFYQMWYGGDSYTGDMIGYATSPRSAATIGLSSSSIDFQNVHPGTDSDTSRVTVTNWGFTLLTISALECRSPEFVLPDLSSLPATIQPFEEMQLSVVFHPSQAGKVVQDIMVVVSNDSSNSRMSIALRGRGSGATQPAAGGTLYGFSATHSGAQLFEINKATGAATLIARLAPHPPAGLYGFAIRPSDNTMYVANSSVTQTSLYGVSSAFGDLELIGSIPAGEVTAMAFSAGDNLYLVDSTGKLYSSKGIGGATTLVGVSGFVFTGLAFSPTTRALWASAHDSLFTVDTLTARATFVGSSGAGTLRSAITFGPLGTLYGLFGNYLVTVNRVTGEAVTIGQTGVSDAMSIVMRGDITEATDVSVETIPLDSKLYQSYPNPFNPSTTVTYDVPKEGLVSLKVYDALGREVATLVNEVKPEGKHSYRFNAAHLPSGVYYYRLQAGSFVETKKFILLR